MKRLILIISLLLILLSTGSAFAQETTQPQAPQVQVVKETDWRFLLVLALTQIIIFMQMALKHQSDEKNVETAAKSLPYDVAERLIIPIVKQILGNTITIESVLDDDKEDDPPKYGNLN